MARTVSRAMILPPMAAWIGMTKTWPPDLFVRELERSRTIVAVDGHLRHIIAPKRRDPELIPGLVRADRGVPDLL
jgi:hypothetical protein